MPRPPPRVELVASLRDVTVIFNECYPRALSNVTLEVRRGEVLGLLGPSGSGKSTTLRLLAGRLRQDGGKVKVFGRSSMRPGTRARIGYLPQIPRHDWSSLHQAWHSFLDMLPGMASTTQQGVTMQPIQEARNRTRLASVFARKRNLILLDAPFVSLTLHERADMKTMVRSLALSGVAVVITSNSLVEAREICNRVALYDEGRIGMVGTPAELLATPGAIRWFARMLPDKASDRVLNIIRQETEVESSPIASNASSDVMPACSESPPPGALADALLASLVRIGTSPPASTATVGEIHRF
jgi:ABC-type multidrug transport system ATPase subunit